ncbi:MAG: tetratricopeptide repeat protein [Acidobacteria bacterium]|nr:tetratricopeptide repeat protein [Acidobacteriota bacterium]
MSKRLISRRFSAALGNGALIVLAAVVGALAVSSASAQDGDPVAVFNRAQDAHEHGDLTGAIKLYEEALKLMPEFPEAELQRGNALESLGKLDEAEAAFRHAVALRNDWSLANAKLGEALVERYIRSPNDKAYAEGDAALKKALELDPNNFPAIASLVDLQISSHASSDKLKETLKKITSLTDGKMNPPASLWAARGTLENRLGDTAAAKKSLQSAIDTDPKNRTALLQLATIALNEKDSVKARAFADRLKPVAPDQDTVRLLDAQILALEGKFDDASRELDTIERPGSGAAELRTQIAAARSADPAALETLLASDPKNAAILGRLCQLYRRDDPVKAREFCRRALDEEPNNIDHAVGFGAALVQDRQFEGAVNIFRRILAVAPENATAHANLATALFELKRYAEAKTEYEWLTNAQPKAAAPYYFLGMVHDQLGEYLDAMANYQIYLKLADPVQNKLDIDKVNLRLPFLQKTIKEGKGKKNGE